MLRTTISRASLVLTLSVAACAIPGAVVATGQVPTLLAAGDLANAGGHDSAETAAVRIDEALPSGLEAAKPIIKRSESGAISSLWFGTREVTDEAVPLVNRCRKLEFLSLNGAPITDAGLAKLQPRPSLRELDVSYTSISDEALPTLSKFRSLEWLMLSGTRPRGTHLAALSDLPKLKCLFLNGTPLHGADLADLRSRSLETLDLSATGVTDAALRTLTNLPGLKELYLADCHVSDFGVTQLPTLRQLRILDLSRTRVTDETLRQLAGVDAAGNPWAPPAEIEDLHLSRTGVSDAGMKYLACLPKLKNLDLNGTAVTDAGLEHLKRLRQLREVDLYMSLISADGLEGIKAAMPRTRFSPDSLRHTRFPEPEEEGVEFRIASDPETGGKVVEFTVPFDARGPLARTKLGPFWRLVGPSAAVRVVYPLDEEGRVVGLHGRHEWLDVRRFVYYNSMPIEVYTERLVGGDSQVVRKEVECRVIQWLGSIFSDIAQEEWHEIEVRREVVPEKVIPGMGLPDVAAGKQLVVSSWTSRSAATIVAKKRVARSRIREEFLAETRKAIHPDPNPDAEPKKPAPAP